MTERKIIILADSSILNPKTIKIFPDLSAEYSAYLNSLLISNWIEVLEGIIDELDIFIVLSEKDQDFIPKNFFPEKYEVIFYNGSSMNKLKKDNPLNSVIDSKNIMFIFYNSIGLKQSDIQRAFSLIQKDEPAVVTAKSISDKVVLTCSAELGNEFVEEMIASNRSYHKFLKYLGTRDIYLHTLEGFLSIDDFEDVKKLYIELSKKESLSYCSPKMHESFNDLFVEYKEKLNV